MIATRKHLILNIGIFLATILACAVMPAVRVLADTYNCGAYGAGEYQNNVCGATTDAGGNDGGLANTGQVIWPIILAVAMILAGTYMLYRTRKKMKQRITAQQR